MWFCLSRCSGQAWLHLHWPLFIYTSDSQPGGDLNSLSHCLQTRRSTKENRKPPSSLPAPHPTASGDDDDVWRPQIRPAGASTHEVTHQRCKEICTCSTGWHVSSKAAWRRAGRQKLLSWSTRLWQYLKQMRSKKYKQPPILMWVKAWPFTLFSPEEYIYIFFNSYRWTTFCSHAINLANRKKRQWKSLRIKCQQCDGVQ